MLNGKKKEPLSSIEHKSEALIKKLILNRKFHDNLINLKIIFVKNKIINFVQ